jgi:hypothetical protein
MYACPSQNSAPSWITPCCSDSAISTNNPVAEIRSARSRPQAIDSHMSFASPMAASKPNTVRAIDIATDSKTIFARSHRGIQHPHLFARYV